MKLCCIKLLLCAFLAAAGVSCTSEGERSTADPAHPKYLRKITYRMTLERGMFREEFKAGVSGQKLSFMLKNRDLKPVLIDEWFQNEPENLKLFYAPCKKGKADSVPREAWIQVWPPESMRKDAGNHRRLPVKLNPNNGILVDVPLDFLQTFSMKGRKKVRLAVKAETNLNSLQLSSPAFEIVVRPHIVSLEIK